MYRGRCIPQSRTPLRKKKKEAKQPNNQPVDHARQMVFQPVNHVSMVTIC